jgi:hypothetical protein
MELIEAIETGTGSRIQPLILFITTADAGRRTRRMTRSGCGSRSCARCAEGPDDLRRGVRVPTKKMTRSSRRRGKKANPGYGISPTKRFMASAAAKAADSPAELASFLRLHLNIRTKQQFRYLEIEPWDRNASLVDPIRLKGRPCYGGLDLGSTSDLTAGVGVPRRTARSMC